MIDTSEKVRVLLVDDHALFRKGLRGLLDAGEYCRVVGEAADGNEFLSMLPASGADVVLLDIDMPGMNGFEAARLALEMQPELKIVVLTMHGEEEYYFKMVDLGVKGFLLKNSEIDEVTAAIVGVAKGGNWVSQELLQGIVGNMKTATHAEEPSEALSARELEVLPLICKGMSNQEIADRLFISKRTVDKHRANILAKTGCKNSASLVAYAIKNSLVEI